MRQLAVSQGYAFQIARSVDPETFVCPLWVGLPSTCIEKEREVFARNNDVNLQHGGTMIEVLVTIVIVTLGLLGIAALFVRSQQVSDEAYQRFQALQIAHQLAETISINRTVAGATVTPQAAPIGYLTGANGLDDPAGLDGFDLENAPTGLEEFHSALIGAQKQVDGGNVRSLVSVVGCVESVGAGSAVDPSRYRVSVAWQGRQESANPSGASLCGQSQYGEENEPLRRVVSLDVQVQVF